MSASTLILLGRSGYRNRLPGAMAAHPGAQLWTLNDISPCPVERERLAPQSDLHFEIHLTEARTPRHLLTGLRCPILVSPFADDLKGREQRYPLHPILEAFDRVIFESTTDYMLAFALYAHSFRRLVFVGMEFSDGEHRPLRTGVHFWLGYALAQGIEIELPPESDLLRRKVPGASEPHAYGQPERFTAPMAEAFGHFTEVRA